MVPVVHGIEAASEADHGRHSHLHNVRVLALDHLGGRAAFVASRHDMNVYYVLLLFTYIIGCKSGIYYLKRGRLSMRTNPRVTASLIRREVRPLIADAESDGLDVLAYLLRMAELEANSVIVKVDLAKGSERLN